MLKAYLLTRKRPDWMPSGSRPRGRSHRFAQTTSDRTSLLGGEPVTVGRAEFVNGWRQTLQNLDAVHHLITCHVITVDGDRATCTATMQGTHVYTNHSGGPVWTVGGRHDYQLERTPAAGGSPDSRSPSSGRPAT